MKKIAEETPREEQGAEKELKERKQTKEPSQKLASEAHLSLKQGPSSKFGSKGEVVPVMAQRPIEKIDYREEEQTPGKMEDNGVEAPDSARKEKISKAFESYSAGQFIKINEGSFKDTYKTGKVLGEG